MQKYRFTIGALFGILLFGLNPVAGLEAPIQLELITVLPINGPPNNQPSGLALYHGKLLTVSDKHDDTIFELVIGKQAANQIPFLNIDPQKLMKKGKRLDLEGITIDSAGHIYLVSETYFRAAMVTDNNLQLKWVTPSFKKWGKKRGLFQTKGAGFEGIIIVGNRLLMCVERQPRGLIEFDLTTEKRSAFITETTRFPLDPGRVPDFTDLYFFKGKIFALQRGAQLISEIVFEDGHWVEKQSAFFGNIENDPKYSYHTMDYGRAEGLAMDGDNIYVILDNNNNSRKDNPTDNRPLLLIMKNSFFQKQ